MVLTNLDYDQGVRAENEPQRPSYQELLAAYDRARAAYERNPNAQTVGVLETGLQFLSQELQRPGKFELGQLMITRGAADALHTAQQIPPEFLLRHKHGNWGELPEEDIRENEWSLENGSRLFSAYQTRTDEKLWVITEWNRSVTTLLLPDEY